MSNPAYYGATQAKVNTKNSYAAGKRILDVAASLIGLLLLLPLMVLIAIAIKLNDPKGGIFFKQTRIGRDYKPFFIYKFRSMVHNAEERLTADPVLYHKYIANSYKLDPSEDPRITPIGRFLRKTSLDEIPQLMNVLLGDMSLVGPRPIVGQELLEYGARQDEFLSVKPGITGYWQVSGRSDVGYPERVELELFYVHHKSLWFDLKILIKTVWVVMTKRGAY